MEDDQYCYPWMLSEWRAKESSRGYRALRKVVKNRDRSHKS